MRRLLVVCLVALLAVPLLALPLPSAAAPTSALYTKAIVVVYPFTATSSTLDREASSRLATIIATGMANTGLVNVTPPPPGTERKDFLAVARANRADYYVTGFISPLGAGVSVVEQVVSVTSGIVVFSSSTQIGTYNDAAGLGDDLAQFISRHVNRGLAAIGTAPPAASPSPQPSSAAQTNLGRLFGRKKATPKPSPKPAAPAAPVATTTAAPPVAAPATPSPSPAPVAAVRNVTPPPTAAPRAAPTKAPVQTADVIVPAAVPGTTAAVPRHAVITVEGTADAALRELATAKLVERTHGERVPTAAAACAPSSGRSVLAGVLSVRADSTFGGSSATFDLNVVDCAGRAIFHRSFSNDAGGAQSAQLAADRAVEAAVGAYLNPPKGRR